MEQSIKVFGDSVSISCPKCENWEEQSVDEQRHHLQSFSILDWKEEVSDMRCEYCKQEFKLNWIYR